MEPVKPIIMKKPLIIAAAVVVLVVGGVIALLVMTMQPQKQASTTQTANSTESVPSSDELQGVLDKLNTALAQADTDRKAAATVLEASKKTVTIDTGSNVTLEQLQQKTTAEIDRRLANLEKARDILNQAVTLDNQALNTTSSANSTIVVEVQKKVKDTMLTGVAAAIKALDAQRQQVDNATKQSDALALAKTVNSRFGSDQMLYAQAVTMKSVQTMTVVFDTLKTARNDLQKQVATLQSSDASAASSAQEKIDSITSLLTTLQAQVASAVALVSAFSTTLATMPSDSAAAAGLVSSYGTIVSQLDGIRALAVTAQEMVKALAAALTN